MLTQTLAAKIFGVTFVFVAVLGIFPNGLVGEGAVFGTNLAHDLVHLAAGLLGLAVGFAERQRPARLYHVTFGLVYAIVAVVGFVLPDAMEELLAVNMADNVLHVLLVVALLVAGFAIKIEKRPTA